MAVTFNFHSRLISHNFKGLNDLLSVSHARVNYFGSRLVVTNGNNNLAAISIDQLTREVLDAAQQRYDADDLTLEERVIGLEITEKLIKFYNDTDYILTRYCFLKLIDKIRHFPLSDEDKWNTPRHRITSSISEYAGPHHTLSRHIPALMQCFQGFSEVKFNQVFGNRTEKNLKKICKYPNGSIRIIATEEAIREKWASNNMSLQQVS